MLENYEEFTDWQKALLAHYVTNTSGSIFALQNLPEVIKGSIFSRYSRSSLGLRSLLLKEFISNEEESAFREISGSSADTQPRQQQEALKKAAAFYDRILDGYGDDSIAELGGAHLAIENISMLAAKEIENYRIGGSPLEKSTRYVYFDQKIRGEYLFYREPVLMTSAYRNLYVSTCNHLFDTYSKLIPQLSEHFEALYPREVNSSQAAYKAALRAKVLDCLRGLLPASTMTNMGVYGNGRFFEHLIHGLHDHNLAEMQEIGKQTYEELVKVIPSFIKRGAVDHPYHKSVSAYKERMRTDLQTIASQMSGPIILPHILGEAPSTIKLIDYEQDAPYKVAAALLFAYTGKSLDSLQNYCKQLSLEELSRVLETAAASRQNRRHKSPRALEHAFFLFEVIADFGVYRDLHRHRMLTQERQMLCCDYGFHLPVDLMDTSIAKEYSQAMILAKEAYDKIAASLPEEAQYVVPMGYNVRWYFHINLRALQWLCELRSIPAGHSTYRYIAQEMAHQVSEAIPVFERFFKFVDYSGYQFGRLDQEEKRVSKLQSV